MSATVYELEKVNGAILLKVTNTPCILTKLCVNVKIKWLGKMMKFISKICLKAGSDYRFLISTKAV